MTKQLLLEVGMEEAPARFMAATLAQLKDLAAAGLSEARLSYTGLEVFGTPRRLTLFVRELDLQQRDLQESVRGPAVKAAYDQEGKPTKALLGFARGQGIEPGAVRQVEERGVEYIYAERLVKGQPAATVLPSVLETCLKKLTFPKPMRWGGAYRFIRPVRWLLALYGNEVLPMEFCGIKASNQTWGHRFLTRGPLAVEEPSRYFNVLERNWVIVDQERRRKLIAEKTTQLARANGGKVKEEPGLLEEITYLVEHPTGFLGGVDLKYMELPVEVLTTSMRKHQRYFPIVDDAGALLPGFIGFRSGTDEHLSVVKAGNEKVLRARLEDASFFWQEDQKQSLAARLPELDRVVYLEGLGSVGDKVRRLVRLVGWLGEHLGFEPWVIARAQRAANLAKSDLVTAMVNEFPELQGIMGERYALAAGEEAEVAQAIGEHYRPGFAGDSLPQTQEGTLVALADKADNLCGCFLAGFIPSGSQDPYGLRRQAQAICSLAIATALPLSLKALVGASYNLYQEQFPPAKEEAALTAELMVFFRQRLQHILREQQVEYDVIDAVLAAGFAQPAAVAKRAAALTSFRQQQEFGALLTAYSRAANLAQKSSQTPVDEELLKERAEKDLWQEILRAREKIAARAEDYPAVLQVMADLRPAVDVFFDDVLVMVEEPTVRENRLGLLGAVAALMEGVADLSKIVQ